MPNAFAFIVVFSWPLAVYLLFRHLPRVEALVWSIVAGYLLLPTRAGVDLPLMPLIDKEVIPALTAAILLAFGMGAAKVGDLHHAGGQVGAASGESWRMGPFLPLVLLLVASPVMTVLTNPEPLAYGPLVLPGLRPYDAISIISRLALIALPFLLAMRYLASPESHVVLLKVIVIGLLVYSLPMLFEVRMSPQLNVMFFGFFPHQFEQHVRAGGYRPVVFLHHGLILAILVAMAIIAAGALWRQRLFEGKRAGQWFFAGLYLMLVLFLSNSLGAFAIAMMFAPAVLLLGTRGQMLVAGAIAVIVLLYPILRSADLIPVDRIVAVAERVSADRAASFQFRIDNEDALGVRAAEKPFAGWGTWGRNQIFDPETGRMLSVTDGIWIIVIGSYGWLGYIAQFGLLTLPTLMLAFGRRSAALTPATAGLSLVMAVNLLDLLPNSPLTPITWMVGGALAGFCLKRDERVQDNPKRSWAMLTDRQGAITRRADAASSGGAADWHSPVRPLRRMGQDDT
jgi:hypothetical protein